MSTENKIIFEELVQKLVALGDSQEEFAMWRKIFDNLTREKQLELIEILKQELKQLEAVIARQNQKSKTRGVISCTCRGKFKVPSRNCPIHRRIG